MLLAGLATAAILLPVLMLRVPPPKTIPPATQPAERTTTVEGGAEEAPQRADRQEASPGQQGRRLPPAARSQPARQSDPIAPDTKPEPIVDRRRVQADTPIPVLEQPESLVTAPAARDLHRERSAVERQRRVAQFGGTPRTENAVEAGLSWLAAHQAPDGSWSRTAFHHQCPQDDMCPGPALARLHDELDPGLTGLCLLAFLGAGYTDRDGPYQEVVTAAVAALLRMQQPDGGFSQTESMAGYNDSLATFALAEFYAMTRDPGVTQPLQRAAAHLVQTQQALGGWDYLPTSDSGRNDTSITAWAVQALQACAVAGIEVPRRALVKAALHFTRAAEPDGRVWYSDGGRGFTLSDNLRPVYRYGPAMTAAGMMCEQLLGWRVDSPLRQKQQALLFEQLPSAALLQGGDPTQLHSYYYWYYGTVALFQTGGESWQRWNGRLRDAILPLQNRQKKPDGQKSHAYGSWCPYGSRWGKWGRMGGRVYTTAICVLTLEIYYRHTPAYLSDHLVVDAFDWQDYLQNCSPRERRLAIECLRQSRVEIAEPVLVDLLGHRDRAVALLAAEILAWFDSPLGRTLLEEVVTTLPPWERAPIQRALERATRVAALPPTAGHVRLYVPERRMATLDLPRAYAGMIVSVQRDGAEIARMVVVQRFTGRTVVVAELIEDVVQAPLQKGDRVVSR